MGSRREEAIIKIHLAQKLMQYFDRDGGGRGKLHHHLHLKQVSGPPGALQLTACPPMCHPDKHTQKQGYAKPSLSASESLHYLLQAKRNVNKLKKPKWGDHCSFGHILCAHRNLIIVMLKVYLRENSGMGWDSSHLW